MANYQKLYYYDFKGLDQTDYTVEIWEDAPAYEYIDAELSTTYNSIIVEVDFPQDMSLYKTGMTISNCSTIPDGTTIIYVNENQYKIYLSTPATATGSNLTALLEYGSNLSSTEIRGDASPFTITYPKFKLFDPIRGSGCQMNLLSQSDKQFIGLYTPDFMKYQIRFKKNGGVYWWGYLDSEMYREPFDSVDNYPVSFTGTDGLALLDRLYYLDDNGDHYTGVASQWTVLGNILKKLNIIWSSVFVGISTTSPELTIGEEETILHKTFVRQDNWYNEDGEPETCRKVLEEILRPYGAFLMVTSNLLYITDINTIMGGMQQFKVYSSVTFAYNSTTNLSMDRGDLSDIGFASPNQQLSIVNGINKQVIRYSPYRENTIMDFNAEEDFTNTGSTATYGQTNYQWRETYMNDSGTWTASGDGKFVNMEVVDGEFMGDQDQYLLIKNTGVTNDWVFSGVNAGDYNKGTLSFTYKKHMPYVVNTLNDQYFIKIQCEIFPRTVNNYTPNGTDTRIPFVLLHCDLICGNYKYARYPDSPNYAPVDGWVASTADEYFIMHFKDRIDGQGSMAVDFANLSDRWSILSTNKWVYSPNGVWAQKPVTIDYLIPIEQIYGDLEFKIYGYTAYGDDTDECLRIVKDLRINNLKMTIVDAKGNEIGNNDIEYTGKMNPAYKNEGDLITLLNGTNIISHPTERGAMLAQSGSTYQNIQTWTRESANDNIENLLMRSVESNYENPAMELTVTINRIDQIVGHLTYSNYLNDVFMITSCTHDFGENTSEITMQAVHTDNVTISKLY